MLIKVLFKELTCQWTKGKLGFKQIYFIQALDMIIQIFGPGHYGNMNYLKDSQRKPQYGFELGMKTETHR